MSILKRAGWILFGVLIGLGGSSIAATKAQVLETPGMKATTPVPVGTVGFVSFLKDSKSNGCWVVLLKDQAVSLASAPAEACN